MFPVNTVKGKLLTRHFVSSNELPWSSCLVLVEDSFSLLKGQNLGQLLGGLPAADADVDCLEWGGWWCCHER